MNDKHQSILIGKKVPAHGGVTKPVAIPIQKPSESQTPNNTNGKK
jgi:hypothetical protein